MMIDSTIGHYRIEEELGRGGMGVVYRAFDERLRRPVALKILPEEMAGEADRRGRILAEARAASALNHPGITTIHEVGEEGEQLFIVMELLAGKTLRAVLVEGPMEAAALARLGAQAANALAAAHAQGIIHGDIKPENIIWQPDQRVKLLDFGIARQMAEETVTLTRTALTPGSQSDGRIAGTVAYMAPEQLRGDASDARADLYSLGVVLYELAAGHRPFPGPTATALMSQILHDVPPALAGPPELARVVRKLLEKRPASRCQSARELHEALAGVARDLERGGAPVAVESGKRALAVLPFTLLTPNAEDEYLSLALADAVIHRLSAGGELLVRPTSTVKRFARQDVDSLAAARELNVQVIVEGSIQKFGPRLRVLVQARNAVDGASLLSTKHDSEITDLFGLQDQIGDELAAALLGSKPPPATAASRPAVNATAYELFLRGRERLTRANRWDVQTAIEMLQNAVKIDAKFADAWACLGEACVMMAQGFEPGPRWIREGEKAIRRAVALDATNAEAQAAKGRLLWTPAKRFQHRLALRAVESALRLNPGAQQAQVWRGLIFYHVGLLEEARVSVEAGLAINPEDALAFGAVGQTACFQGKYEEAVDFFSRGLRIDPAALWSNLFLPVALLYLGKLDRAEQVIRTAQQFLPGDTSLLSCEALLCAKRGEKRKAKQLLHKALRGGKTLIHTHHLWHNAAGAYALMGRPAPAMALLRKAAALGLPCYPAFRDDPNLIPLRNHQPFLRLMADLKRECASYQREFGRRS